MDFTTLLVVLGLTGTAWSVPITDWTCPEGCTLTPFGKTHQMQPIKLLLDLQETSVAPWSLEDDRVDGREPRSIVNAKCMECSIAEMDPKPIKVQTFVYRMTNNGTHTRWCKCPYEMAVGCTCVRRQQVAS